MPGAAGIVNPAAVPALVCTVVFVPLGSSVLDAIVVSYCPLSKENAKGQ